MIWQGVHNAHNRLLSLALLVLAMSAIAFAQFGVSITVARPNW